MDRARIGTVAIALVAAAAAFIVVGSVQPTEAAWTTGKALSTTVTSVTPAQPTGLSCPGSGLLAAAVPFTWTAPPGTAPSGYTLKWTGAANGSSTHTGTSGGVTSPLGTITVSVYADYGNWQSAAAIQTRQVAGIIFVGWTCS